MTECDESQNVRICRKCGNSVDDCDCDPRCSECERFPCICEEG